MADIRVHGLTAETLAWLEEKAAREKRSVSNAAAVVLERAREEDQARRYDPLGKAVTK